MTEYQLQIAAGVGSIAKLERKERERRSSKATGAGNRRLRVEIPTSTVRGVDDKRREWARLFRNWSG